MSRGLPRGYLLGVSLGLLLLLATGLSASAAQGKASSTDAASRKGKELPPDPVVIQQTLLRLADELTANITAGLDQLQRGSTPAAPAEVLQWKIAFATATCSIASGSNAVANLLDLTVLITMTRATVEDYWIPNVFGESAQPLLASCRSSEAELWRLTGNVLTVEQQAELRQGIEEWHRQNPRQATIVGARAAGFAEQILRPDKAGVPKLGSVFSLIGLDPLSGLDPATREIAQSRLLAERVLYVTQKMPQILRWQLELLNNNALSTPAAQQLLASLAQMTVAVDRVSRVAEQLPAQVSAERAEIISALQSQEKGLANLAAEVRSTLGQGTEMSASLNTTLTTLDGVMKRVGLGEPVAPGTPPGEPFRIQDYTQTAAQVEATARQLTELLRTLDQILGSPQVQHLSTQADVMVQQAQAGGKAVVDHAFGRAVLFVAIIFVLALLYRFLSARITPANRTKTDQS